MIFVRHALAGSRQDWKGDDDERPLEDAGYVQAAALAVTLAAYRPARLISSPSKRCMQTLKPYALRSGLPIAKDRLLTETGYDHARALELALSVLDEGRPAVICSHGKVLDDLIAAVCERRYHSPSLSRTMDAHLRKGAFAVLHHAGGRVITAERYIV
ncbi:SixA phosphatase family protein [Thermocatellispora tengchongensis]|uniref:SixA phosphatase family protein n=1 Tax=Thermocatellispora tengchongensis TaxID=1073253 RepID=UPI00362E63D7